MDTNQCDEISHQSTLTHKKRDNSSFVLNAANEMVTPKLTKY